MMDTKKLILGTAAYTICTFSLAVVWHVLLFKERYESFGYFEGEPSFLLGLLSIVLQGVLLCVLFPMLKTGGGSFRRGLRFASSRAPSSGLPTCSPSSPSSRWRARRRLS